MKANLKIVMVIIVTVCMILAVSINSFAADSIIISQNNVNETTNDAVNNVGTNQTNTPTTTVVAPTTNTSVSNYNNTNTNTSTLPKTGENDIYIVTVLLVVCGISAIYAYKKIRDYNM